jgi:hypothetical protein
MTRSWIAAATAGLVVSFAACSNSEQSRSQNPQSARESQTNPSVTLTGCLTPGTQSNEFVLQNVRGANDAQATGGVTPTSYVVVAASTDVDLMTQLNHQVEVKGRPATAASETPPPNQRTETRAELNRPRLIVSDITSIADKCTAPTP